MGTEPRSAWRLTDGVTESWTPAAGWHGAHSPADPLGELRQLLRAHTPVEVPELGRFWCGAVGYFSYDVARLIEHLPNAPRRIVKAPDALFLFTGVMVIIDNLRASARVVTGVPVQPNATAGQLRGAYNSAVAELSATIERLRTPVTLPSLALDDAATPAQGESSCTREEFVAAVERIREYIFAGDCFQALLARRIVVKHDFSTRDLYRALRVLNPSPYMYHLVLDGVELVGSSPELLVRMGDNRVTVRPIAGTRPRGSTPADDERLARELLADEKERAEHVMLVDLGRNDIGRIANYGSVSVTDLMTVEKYSHVLHIVSQVEGTLPPDASAIDVFRATFPAGTMTGAPKVRAMQIIDELEPVRRGPYAGAVGYIAAGDTGMDMAITIRTCVVADGEASVQAGAGIVADSNPEREWEETESKARALLTAIGRVRSAGIRNAAGSSLI
jgi:anthranilate synthase component 1